MKEELYTEDFKKKVASNDTFKLISKKFASG